VKRDGNFEAVSVLPGSYIVSAVVGAAQTGGTILYGEENVQIGASDVDGLRLTLEPAGSITGTVRFQLSNPASAQSGATNTIVNLSLTSDTRGQGVYGQQQWEANHLNATFSQVLPGQYTLLASVPPSYGTWVKSATLRGQDVLNHPFTVNGATGPIEIVVSDDTGNFSAMVTDADDHPASASIVLKPATGQAIIIQAGEDGNATRQGIPSGEYKAWAFDDITNVPWAEDDWMTQHAGAAQQVTITNAGTTNVTLKRMAAPSE
jgi:hypothetical protein